MDEKEICQDNSMYRIKELIRKEWQEEIGLGAPGSELHNK